MSEEIKLGWYQQNDEGGSRFRVVFIRDDGFCLPILYLGPELPPQGEWVDIDLAKTTLADLPLKARFRDYENQEWDEPNQLCAFESGDDYNFRCQDGTCWKYCQVWRPL